MPMLGAGKKGHGGACRDDHQKHDGWYYDTWYPMQAFFEWMFW